jgi:hypothetical protein
VARDHLLLVRFLDETIRPRVRRYDADDVRAHEVGRSERFLASLDAIRTECEKRGIRFVVATQQAASLLVPREKMRGLTYEAEESLVKAQLAKDGSIDAIEMAFLAHANMMRALREWATAHGVPLVDVIAATDERRDILVSWVHLSPEGNEMIAEAFAPTILSLTCPGAPARVAPPDSALARDGRAAGGPPRGGAGP